MNIQTNPARVKAAFTYNAAADHFDHTPLAFWGHHGRRAVELAGIGPGDRVLDVGCGTGSSALPAAAAAAPDGAVLGIDIADNMLQRARDKAAARGLNNVAFRQADMTAPGEPNASFDVVIGVFSVFFVPEMERQIGKLWRMVRPGGRLAVTVWGPGAFEPASTIFLEEIRRVRPNAPPQTRPWERLTNPDNLRRLFMDGGAAVPVIHETLLEQNLSDPADWWTIAMGSGFRWEIEQLVDDEEERVKERVLQRLADENVTSVPVPALHAIARNRGIGQPIRSGSVFGV